MNCRECGLAYTARERDDGTFILPTADGVCACGTDAVEAYDVDESPSTASD
ncbi:hypothetical protein [Halomarina rubra]|uniref:Small CPxCG-related zinc finger protein n=1 Tax=Halomarina rubra TaxID=2071873 RepID=A0ABD6AQT6_9EURY|nr:hypothetical protein [Halomarina rubra]